MNRLSKLRLTLQCFFFIGWFHSGVSMSAEPDTQPIEDFFRHPKNQTAILSPSGRYLGVIAPFGKRLGIGLIDLTERKSSVVTQFNDADVATVLWVNDKRLVFTVKDQDKEAGADDRGGGLYAVDRDGANFKLLVPSYADQVKKGGVCVNCTIRRVRYFSRTPDRNSDDVIIESWDRTRAEAAYSEVYRVNTRTGHQTHLTFNHPEGVFSWVLDKQGQARIALSDSADRRTTIIWMRADKDSVWEKIHQAERFAPDWYPTRFDKNGKLYLASNRGRDTTTIQIFDPATKQPGETLLSHPVYDIAASSLVFDADGITLVGARIATDRTENVWFDERLSNLQAGLDKALPGRVNFIQRPQNEEAPVLVFSYSDKHPGSYFLLDQKTMKMELVLATRPWIDEDKMGSVNAHRYVSRDGLQIPANLTLPPGSDGKNLPVVVLVHGGPFVRGNHWRWDPEAQFLASRGYAVLEPEFRGSHGYGWKHFKAGWKQWGDGMLDDITDGVATLVKQGIADPKRVCVMGGSYGGYAASMAPIRSPGVFKCAVNLYGVTDVGLLFSSAQADFAYSPWLKFEAKSLIGDPDKESDRLIAISPSKLAEQIKIPVFMAYGTDDRRVPIEHGTRLRDALTAAGNPPEWVTYTDAGHGVVTEKNQIDLYGRIERFLAKHIGRAN